VMVGATPESMTAGTCLSVPVSEQAAAPVTYAAALVVVQAEQLLGFGRSSDSLPGHSKAACFGPGSKHDPTFSLFPRAGGWA
jgi:hypothetical protein